MCGEGARAVVTLGKLLWRWRALVEEVGEVPYHSEPRPVPSWSVRRVAASPAFTTTSPAAGHDPGMKATTCGCWSWRVSASQEFVVVVCLCLPTTWWRWPAFLTSIISTLAGEVPAGDAHLWRGRSLTCGSCLCSGRILVLRATCNCCSEGPCGGIAVVVLGGAGVV